MNEDKALFKNTAIFMFRLYIQVLFSTKLLRQIFKEQNVCIHEIAFEILKSNFIFPFSNEPFPHSGGFCSNCTFTIT